MAILNDDGTITVEAGDTFAGIATLLDANGIKVSIEELMAMNPDSMSAAGDPRTLQIGATLNSSADGATDDGDGDGDDTPADEPATPAGPVAPPATVTVGTGEDTQQVIPRDAYLIRLRKPVGSDFGIIYYLAGTLNGIEVAYEVGTSEDLKALFGGAGAFDRVVTYDSQAQFDDDGVQVVGTADEVIGATESFQAQFDRDLRSLDLESVPDWMRSDPQVMAMLVIAAREGWSPGRTMNELTGFDAFRNRFTGFDTLSAQLGTTDANTIVTEHLRREAEIRQNLSRFRGPNTDTSNDYVLSLVGSGWDPAEVGELLELERDVINNEQAFANINQILAANGMEVLSADDFVDFLREGRQLDQDDALEPSQLFNAVNDALRLTSLQQAGLDVGTDLASELGTEQDMTGIASPSFFKDEAQQVAAIVAANFHELEAGKFGLTQDAVIQAFLGQGDEDTKRSLEQFARERNIAARGFERSTAFTASGGRLRIQGYGDL